MISPEEIAEIRRLFFAEHWKIGTIAAQLKLHPETVRKAVLALGLNCAIGNRRWPSTMTIPKADPFEIEALVKRLKQSNSYSFSPIYRKKFQLCSNLFAAPRVFTA